MNWLKTSATIFGITCCLYAAIAQNVQPAYFIFGEEEFKGAQIYDIIQDHDLNFWFSTNEGLIFYNHYSFKKVFCSESRSLSYFNFVINQHGDIYCNNLNNQIFVLRNQSCELFYTLENDDSRPDLRLIITPQDELLIGGKNFILVDEYAKRIKKFSDTYSYSGYPYLHDGNEIFISALESDSVLVFKNSDVQRMPLKYVNSVNPAEGVLFFFNAGNDVYAINNSTKTCYEFNPQTQELTSIVTPQFFNRSESMRFYQQSDLVWVAGTLPGIFKVDTIQQGKHLIPFYKDYFISKVYQDAEGNTLLGTFDKGVLVIPDLRIDDAFEEFKGDHVTCVEWVEDRGLLVGTSKGRIAIYQNGQFDFIHESGKRAIEVIVCKKGLDHFIFDDGQIRDYNFSTGKVSDLLVASLKDGVFDQEKNVYLATNLGLIKLDYTGNSTEQFWIPELKFRNYSIAYDSINDQVFIATANGLFGMQDDSVYDMGDSNQPVFSSNLNWAKNKLYASLNEGGMMVWDEQEKLRKLDFDYKNVAQIIFRFEIVGEKIYALTSSGMLEFDLDGNFLALTENRTGQNLQRVTDFEVLNDTLWVSNADGFQRIPLLDRDEHAGIPALRIDEIFVNDQMMDENKPGDFASSQRKISFVLHCPTLKYKNKIQYQYRLLGYDSTWINQPYKLNEITFNALSAGDYEFQAKPVLNNQFGNTVTYQFSIASPFYATAWFILSAVVVFILMVYFIYRYQLDALRKKTRQEKELYASKLTAIRSQMNPHFIFNSLNSIQDLVLKGDVENSYTYITTFSNLVRRTLNYSDKEFIDFDQEIKLLELYLSLEKLRFKNDFTYELNIGEISDIALPPMLIQPFIENALIHGLLHKNGNKKISISFHLNDDLICTVEDNGIGRAKAKEIKSRKTNQFESFSLKAIEKRFEILNTTQQTHGGFTYIDLIENGEVKGTRVVISIPYKRRF